MQQTRGKWSTRKFRFNWGVTAFTLLLFPVLVSFGLWQLDREQQKIRLQNQYENRASEQPIEESDLDWNSADLGWMPITATGNFNSEKQFLLDNRILDSKVGYEIITPFTTETGTILVNRGWIAQGQSRTEIPDLTVDEGRTEIVGHIYVPDGETFTLGADGHENTSWPKLIQKVDVDELATSLGTNNARPFIVRLRVDSPGVLQTNWAAINMQPEVHRAYAVQWFLMAAVLLILYIMFSFKQPEN
ncbi:MAG: SURF1 family protein [Gammaproteobacteria bacterium]|nr:SURF1 family protein [Gammaproteobacteria bacterium]